MCGAVEQMNRRSWKEKEKSERRRDEKEEEADLNRAVLEQHSTGLHYLGVCPGDMEIPASTAVCKEPRDLDVVEG